ncbi:Excinuclease ABC subunit C [Clostridium sp. IBUN13A]|uniref:Uncharacterized protein n=2 Tax=Clostridium butyricum TaxID=1492 RepID=C4ICW1_CLOBU|nr:hypothetical protein CBY_1860 [Clostridium butyricum 5521]EEP55947.1 hypothetical protein CLP_3187 [Clostridium butyricum E4 str. BoNT E BL5262]KIU06415.1 hypothetical protein SC08_Contig83orf00163 [Clostridium butyricum]KJZ85779.1 hypothetical protein ClosIBUN125C_CONTIG48g02844 [Clostridium sp. IBUN125C]KJZ91634.1 hypothetical protein ClosIBUN62F_CONTIG7g00307 [Clostridium sp. IBUN62F]KJZ94625.1 hypothetical protein ClosIBUN22A_CONTIG141g02910 [Clostridium sp. IBUN22A]KJZ94724.1 Excinucl
MKNKEFKRTVLLSVTISLALVVYFFYSACDIPFVYSQF